MTEAPNLLSRAVRKLAGKPPAEPQFTPWADYYDPDFEPVVDSVTVRMLSPAEQQRYRPTEAAIEGAKIEARVRAQINGRRWLDAHRGDFEKGAS